MLEPDVGKLASPVLRGRGGGNIALLPGLTKVTMQEGIAANHPILLRLHLCQQIDQTMVPNPAKKWLIV
jgi:hypothetical protein